jgi:hypothetical protein
MKTNPDPAMKYYEGDILIPVSAACAEFHDQRIQVLGYDEDSEMYHCGWIVKGILETGYTYSQGELDEEQLDEVVVAKRILKSYEC